MKLVIELLLSLMTIVHGEATSTVYFGCVLCPCTSPETDYCLLTKRTVDGRALLEARRDCISSAFNGSGESIVADEIHMHTQQSEKIHFINHFVAPSFDTYISVLLKYRTQKNHQMFNNKIKNVQKFYLIWLKIRQNFFCLNFVEFFFCEKLYFLSLNHRF